MGSFLLPAKSPGARNCQQVVDGAASDENSGNLSDNAHCVMKTTPIRINATPAQRRPSTASFKSTLARRVSGMKAAADIGTAKLIGAIDTSFMNEKNETAIAQVEIITNELRTEATIPTALPIAPGRKSGSRHAAAFRAIGIHRQP